MTWPPEGAQDFVGWLEAEYGAGRRSFLAECWAMSEYEAGAVWSLVLVHAWRVGASFEHFESGAHVRHWVLGRVRWAKRIRRMNLEDRVERERRLWTALAEAGESLRPGDASPGAEAFSDVRLEAAWEAMSPKRRVAVEAVVLCGMRLRDVAEIEGVGSNTVSMNVTQGLDELRRRYDGTYVSRADAVRAATRRRMVARVAV